MGLVGSWVGLVGSWVGLVGLLGGLGGLQRWACWAPAPPGPPPTAPPPPPPPPARRPASSPCRAPCPGGRAACPCRWLLGFFFWLSFFLLLCFPTFPPPALVDINIINAYSAINFIRSRIIHFEDHSFQGSFILRIICFQENFSRKSFSRIVHSRKSHFPIPLYPTVHVPNCLDLIVCTQLSSTQSSVHLKILKGRYSFFPIRLLRLYLAS